MLPVCLISDFNNSKFNNIKNIYPYLDYDHFNTMLFSSNSLKIDNGVQKTLFRDTFKEITPKYNLKKLEKPVGTLHRIYGFQINIQVF